MSEGDLPYITEARTNLSKLVLSVDELTKRASALHASDKDLNGKVADLTRRLSEAEQRATEAERLSDELREKAERGERLDKAATKMVASLDALPAKIEDGTTIPGANRPAIALYGTYEWRAVTDANFLMNKELKERRTI